MANIFDTINKMYNGRETEWNKISNYEKSLAYFVLNRAMSMIYPIISAELSRIKISASGVMEYWQSVLSKQYYKTPSYFYQINPKKKKEEKFKKTKSFIPTKEVIEFYCNTYNIDNETFKEAEILYKDDLYEELEKIQKAM